MINWRGNSFESNGAATIVTLFVGLFDVSVRWLLVTAVYAGLLFPVGAFAQFMPYFGPPVATQAIASKTVILNETTSSFTPVIGTNGAGALVFDISPALPAGLSLNTATGEISGSATVLLSATTFTVTVTDHDSPPQSNSNTFSLTVDSPVGVTVLVSSKSLLINNAANFTPVTASGGTSPITLAVAPSLPSGLSLDSSTGAVTGTPTVASAVTTYTVTATDGNGVTATGAFALSVQPAVTATQAVASTTLTRNAAATPFTPVTGTPGLAPLAFSVSPSLPSGLTLASSTGAISGTPTQVSGATTYTVTVTDASNASATATFSLSVSAAVSATQAVASTTLNQNVAATTFTPVTGSGGTSPLSFSVSPSLPAGLTMSSSTGAVSGTPTVGSSLTTYTVSATDANGGTATATFNLTVIAPLTATQAIASEAATLSKAVTSFTPVMGSGGSPAYVYAISPALPSGLALSTSTGAITGTPSATRAATTYTVTITDAASATATATFSLTVNTLPSATRTLVLKTLTQGTAVTPFTPVTGAGGTAPLAFSISPAMPAGLSLSSSTGAVTGTPTTTSAATSFVVTVTDANGATAVGAVFNLGVNAAVAATQSVASKVLTQNKSTPFTPVTGSSGTRPLAYSISPSLPAGLTLSSTNGAITGTPTATSAATSYTVTIVDTNNSTASSTFSLTVNAAVAAMQSIASKALTQNIAATPFTPVTGSGGTGSLSYSISPALPAGLALSSTTGAITGTPTATSSATTYSVTVTDANSAIATASFIMTVNSPPTTTVAVASKSLTQNKAAASFIPVTAANGAAPLAYSVSPALPTGLSLSSSTGAITGAPTDVNAASTYTVTVSDANGATASSSFSLAVNAAVTATQAVASMTLTATRAASFTPVTGAGGTSPLTYSISPGMPGGLSLSASTGAITGTPTSISSVTTYTVTVTDANSATATATFSMSVNISPTATRTFTSKTLTQGAAVTPFTPATGTGGTSPLAYSISPALPAGLSLSSSTGAVTGTPTAASTATAYSVTVTDANGVTAASAVFNIGVSAAVTATQALASKELTASRATTSFTPVTGGGGTAPLAYSVAPALPTGLTLSSSTGAVTGTPTAASAATTYTVTIADANNATASATFSLTVNSAVSATQAVASKGLTATRATASFTPVTGAGGTSPLAYSVSPALPAGLTISSATGAITGTATVASAATTYTVTVTDANSATATATFSLTVNGAVSATQAIATKSLTLNTAAASFTPVTSSGGTSPLAYSISPSLPAGLTLSSTTGAITGTPTATSAATTYMVTVNDVNSATANATFSLTVNAAVTATQALASKALTQNAAAASFTPVTGAGGTGPLAYSVSPALPAGLAMSLATGAITGTPTATSSATAYTVTVTDANSSTASATFSLTVNSAVSATQAVASKTLTQNTVAASFTPVTGAGGTGALGYSIAPALPSGLSLSSSTGAITGTPTTASVAATYTVTVTDAVTATATATFSLAVNVPVAPAQVATGTTTISQSGGPVSFTPVTVSGGAGPFTYSVSPTLPAGLTMSSAGVITGSPTVTTGPLSYTVTVVDSNGATITATFTMAVNAAVSAAQAIPSTTLTRSVAAASFTPVTAADGAGPLAYSVSPSLPSGLALSTATGAITGTPIATSATTTYTVTVTDANNATATATFGLTVIAPAPTVSSVSPAIGASDGLTVVTITGADFTAATGVTIGGAAATNVSVLGDMSITATTPAGAPGAASVVVTTASGQNAANSLFTYAGPLTATIALPFSYLEQNQPVTPFIPVIGSNGVAPLTYSAASLPSGLSMDPQTGAVSGTPTASVFSSYTVVVRDANNSAVSRQVSISVWTNISSSTQVSSVFLTQGLAASSFTPVLGSGGRTPYVYSATGLPAGLAISPSTGAISGTPTSASASASYGVTVTDALGYASSSNFTAVVNPALALSPAAGALAGGSIGVAYSQSLAASGGVGPYALTLASGSLPPGLSLGVNGLSGTPTTAGAYSFSVTATDTTPGGPVSLTAAYTLTVTGAPSVTSVSPSSDFTYGGATITISGTNLLGASGVTIGGTAATNVVVTNAGSISATVPPGAAGTASVVVTTGGGASGANGFFSYRVPTPSPNPPAGPLTAGAVGSAYSVSLTATGGTAPYTTALTSGALPAGLTLSNNVLSGSPTIAGTYAFTITTTDSTSPTPLSVPSPYTLSVTGAPTVASVSPSTGPANGGTSVIITGANFLGATAVTIGGAPATGVTVISATSISATVPAGSVGSASVVVTTGGGSNGANGLFSYTQPVLAAIPAAGALTPAAVGTAYSQSLTASGGVAPYAASLKAGSVLPPGLSLTSNSIAGVPTNAGSYTFTITVTDSSSPSASSVDVTYSLSITGAPTLASVSPPRGPTAGGTPITLTGTHFLGATGVTIGGAAASNVAVISATTITAIAPAGTVGSASVVVTTPGGANGANAAYAYTAALTATQAVASKTLTQNLAATSFTPVTGGGGVGPLAYSVLPALPAGLTMASSTGAITGTPSSASAVRTYTVSVVDADNSIATAAFSLTVNSPVTVTQAIPTKVLLVNAPAAAFTPVTASGGAGTFSYSVSPTLPAGLTMASATGAITGTPTVVTAATTYTVTVTDANSATSTATFSLSVSKIASSIVLASSSSTPSFGASVTLTATVTPTAATGAVTFKDGATTLGTGALTNGVATFSTAALSAGTHALTVVYAGDALYGASTSSALTVNVRSSRPDPSIDANVRGIVVAQVATAFQTAQQATSTVQQRLEAIHSDDTSGFSNGVAIRVLEARSTAIVDRSEEEKNLLAYGALRNPAMADPIQRILAGKDLGPTQNETKSGGKVVSPDYHLWTAGSIILGEQSYTGQVSQNRFAISGVTGGVDTNVMQNVKAGFAVSLSSDRTKINNGGASNNGTTVTGTAYASWRAAPKLFIDSLLGYGRLNFASSRYDANALSAITGSRSGSVLFASVIASFEQQTGAFKYAPFGGLDLMMGALDAYTEQGASDWALSYASTSVRGQGLILGLRGQYDVETPWGTLSPTARLQLRHGMAGQVTQSMSYASDPTTSYALALTGTEQNSLSTTLGLRFSTKTGPSGQLEFTNNASGGSRQSNGVRGMMMAPF